MICFRVNILINALFGLNLLILNQQTELKLLLVIDDVVSYFNNLQSSCQTIDFIRHCPPRHFRL